MCLGVIWGDEYVKEDFKAVLQFETLKEKVVNICESDIKEASDRKIR